MFMPAQLPIDALKEIGDQAKYWHEQLRGRRLRRAATRLRHAALVVAAMHLYETDVRRVYDPLLGFEPTWSEAERQAAYDGVFKFEHDQDIYTSAQESVGALKRVLITTRPADATERDAFESIKTAGESFLTDYAVKFRALKWSYNQPDFQSALTRRDSEESPDIVKLHAEEMLSVVSDLRVTLVDQAFRDLGSVEVDFEQRFGMPKPKWLAKLLP